MPRTSSYTVSLPISSINYWDNVPRWMQDTVTLFNRGDICQLLVSQYGARLLIAPLLKNQATHCNGALPSLYIERVLHMSRLLFQRLQVEWIDHHGHTSGRSWRTRTIHWTAVYSIHGTYEGTGTDATVESFLLKSKQTWCSLWFIRDLMWV